MYNHASMNRVYRVVWNAALGVWQAVGEIGKGAGKGKSHNRRHRRTKVSLAGALFLVSSQLLAASLPENGVVTSGAGSISQPNANTLNITQATDKLAIDWQSFSIGQGNTVNFIQPSVSAIALNRVVGNDVSNIQGAINANGQVFLINPNGVLFSTTAQVNVGGLVASTRNITNDQFNAGNFRFEGDNSNAIINQGNIKTADGGYVVMIAATIENTGNITANKGSVALGAGNLVTLDMGGPVKLRVEQGAVDALIQNGGAIRADGGHILLSAKSAGDLAASVINNTGRLVANSLEEVGGKIVLMGDEVNNSGTISANAAPEVINAPAGAIEITAERVTNSGVIEAKGNAHQAGGRIQISGAKIEQTQTALIDASATKQGGSVELVAREQVQISGTINVSAISDSALQTPSEPLAEAPNLAENISTAGQILVKANQIELMSATLEASGGQGGVITLDAAATQSVSVSAPSTPPAPLPEPQPSKLALNGLSQLNTRGRLGKGGNQTLIADDIHLNNSTTLSATGATGGGQVLVGGDWQGSGYIYQATTVTMEAGVTIDASATNNGDGGKVVLWSDITNAESVTSVQGSITAKGGAQGGNGGKVETSGAALEYEGITVDTQAADGTAGDWLLDPRSFFFNQSQLDTLATNLSSSNINIQTGTNSASGGPTTIFGSGHIVFDGNFTYTGSNARTLGLNANEDVWLNGNVTSTAGALSLTFTLSPANKTVINGDITTRGGSVSFYYPQNVHFQKTSGTQTVNTGGGSLNFNESSIYLLRHDGEVVFNTGTGNINLGSSGTVSQTNTRYAIDGDWLRYWGGRHADGIKIYPDQIVAGDEYKVRLVYWDSWGGELGSFFIQTSGGNVDYFRANKNSSNQLTNVTALNGTQVEVSYNGDDAAADFYFTASHSGSVGTYAANASATASEIEIEHIFRTGFSSQTYSTGSRSLTLQTTTGGITGGNKNFSGLKTLTIDSGANFDLTSGIISGTTDLVKKGTGRLGLMSNNTYTGITTVEAGTLGLYQNAALGDGQLNLANNTILLLGRAVTEVSNNINLTGDATVDLDTDVEYLVVGGGGGGGSAFDGAGGGGGGAGGMLTGTTSLLGGSSLTVTVGVGGAGGVLGGVAGQSGGSSSLGTSLTAMGGGGGANHRSVGSSGGSGGGAGARGFDTRQGGAGVAGQGNAGGSNSGGQHASGGGGAGGAGGSNGNRNGGAGLTSSITGSPVTYAIGGQGGVYGDALGNNSGTAASGYGGGGGGASSAYDSAGPTTPGSAGNSGIVVARYKGSAAGTGGTVSTGTGTALGYTLHTFTSTGTNNLTLNAVVPTLSGVISGSGKLAVNATDGSITLSGANTYAGGTDVIGGTLKTSNAAALGSGAVSLGNVAGALLDVTSNLAVGSLAGGGTTGGNISLASGATLNAGALNTDTSYAGVISGAGGLTKTGSGTQTLTNNSTYTGATTINQGTLVLQNNAPTSATSGFSGVGALVIESASDSFSSAFSNSGWTFGSDLGGLTIGKTTNTQAINIDNAISIAGPISLNGGNLALNKAVTTSDTLSLKSSGTITQSNLQADAITANSLLLAGGNVTLNNVYNNVNTLAASGVSGLTYTNLDALTIGTVGSTNGVYASGVVDIATQTEDLTLAKSVVTTISSATALTLNAGKGAGAGSVTGGNLIVTNNSTVTVGTGGTAKLFTGSILGSTGLADMTGLGVASGRFRYYSDETTTNFTNSGTTALTSGLNAIFRERPTAAVSLNDTTVTYGDALGSLGTVNTTVKSVDGNSDIVLTGSTALGDELYTIVGRTNSTSGNIKASSTAYAVSSDLAGLGYAVSGTTNANLTVNTKALTMAGFAVDDKVYDGNTAATISNAGTLSGLASGDVVTVSNTGATFDSKDAGTDKTVTLNGVALAGADKDNYTLANNTTAEADITPKVITLSATKTYDGTTDLSGSVTLGGFVGSETLTFSGATASDKHVATAGKYVNAITLLDGINGGLASNYALPILNAANAAVTITAATLTPTLTNTGVTKVYDGTTKAPVSAMPTWSFAGLVNGDTSASLNFSDVAYNSKDVDVANQLTVSGLTIDSISGSNGSLAGDYVLDATSKSVSATITPAALTISANNDARFFSQTDTPGYAGTSFTGFVNGETTSVLDIAGLTISRSDSSNNAAGTYTLTPTGATANRGNYAITYQNGTYTIVPAGQLLVKVSNLSRTYGTAVDYSIGSAAYLASDNSTINTVQLTDNGNRFSGDGVSFDVTAIGSSTSTAGKINVGSYQLGGSVTSGNSTNFSNNLVVVGALDVTQKSISASASGVSKTYDGTTDMTGVILGLSTLETNDVVTVNGMGAFAQKNVGTNLGYTVSNLTLSGADASNYYLSGGASLTGSDGTISAKTLTLNNIAASDKVYDGSANATVSADLAGLVATDSGAVTVAISATFADKNVGTHKAVSINSVTLSGSEAANYSIASTAPAQTANISRLNSVNWVGGANGNWFDPDNWAGRAIPDLANVANVVIPSGVIVNFDTSGATGGAQTGAVEVDALGTNGTLIQTNGSLNIGAGGTTLFSYVQNGGTFTNAGSTTLNNFSQTDGSFSSTRGFSATNFSQSGGSTTLGADLTVNSEFSQGTSGSVTVSGDSTITDSSAGMVVGNLSTQGNTTITSNGGAISQANGTTLIANGTTSLTARNGGTAADISLNGANNNFVGEVSANGANITLIDGVGDLVLADVTASAKLDARATDNVLLNGALNVDSVELLATNGHITQGTNSTLVVATGETDLSAAGAIRLDKANDFNGAVNIANATDVVLNDTNALELGAIAMSGALDVVAQNNISQKSNTGIVSGGQVDFASTAGNVVLDSVTNSFGGRFDASGQQVALTNYNQPLSLGDIVVHTALNIVTNNKAITQAPNTTIKSNGTSAMDAGSSSIALTNTGNDYGAITLNAAQVTRAETLSEAAARLSADEAARLAAEEAARLAAEEAARLAAEEAARLAAEEAARLATEEAARLATEEAARLATEEAARLAAEEVTSQTLKEVVTNSAVSYAQQIPTTIAVTQPNLSLNNVVTTGSGLTNGAGVGNSQTAGIGGVSGGLTFVDLPEQQNNNEAEAVSQAKQTAGLDSSGFMRVVVVRGGINTGALTTDRDLAGE